MSRCAKVLAVAFTAVVAFVGSGGAAGADTPPAPKLAFSGHSKPVLYLVDNSGFATATVAVSNTGAADATGLTFLLLADDTAGLAACGVQALTVGAVVINKPCASTPAPVTLAAGATERYVLTFLVPPPARPLNPLIEMQSAASGVAPALTESTVSRSLSNGRLWWPIWAALIVPALFLALGAYATRDAANRDVAVPAKVVALSSWATAKIYTGSSWSFKDSWATNITAVGGVLGTVLGSTGFFSDVLPGVSVGRFTGFSLLFGGVAVLAPIVYTALSRKDPTLKITVGTVAGLLVASAVTVAAVAGELMTIGLLVRMSDVSSRFETLCFVGLVIAGLVVVIYATRSAGWLCKLPPPSPPPKAAPADAMEAVDAPVVQRLGPAPSGYAVMPAGVP